MNLKRVLPTPHFSARWNRSGDEYPETLRVRMADGRCLTYRREADLPAFRDSLEIIRRMKKPVIGYPPKEKLKPMYSYKPKEGEQNHENNDPSGL